MIPGLRRSPGEGKGYPLQYPGLENSMDSIVGLQRVGHNWATFTFTLYSIDKNLIHWNIFKEEFKEERNSNIFNSNFNMKLISMHFWKSSFLYHILFYYRQENNIQCINMAWDTLIVVITSQYMYDKSYCGIP